MSSCRGTGVVNARPVRRCCTSSSERSPRRKLLKRAPGIFSVSWAQLNSEVCHSEAMRLKSKIGASETILHRSGRWGRYLFAQFPNEGDAAGTRATLPVEIKLK